MRAFLLSYLLLAGCTTQLVVRDAMIGFHQPDRALRVAVYDFYDANGRWPSSVAEFPPSIMDALRLEQYRVLQLQTEPDGNLKITYEYADGKGEGWVSLAPPQPTPESRTSST